MEKCACQYFYEKKLAGGRNLDRPPAFRWTMYRVLLLFLYFASYITVNARSYLKTRAKRHYTARNVRVPARLSCHHFFTSTFYLLPIIYIPRRSCNFPNISYSIAPSKYTLRPHNPVPFLPRNQDKLLYPYILSPIHQTAFRTLCICTVKKAFSFTPHHFFYRYYTLFTQFLQGFSPYKIAFPLKKLSKNPPTSNPVFSKHPIKSPTVAFLN